MKVLISLLLTPFVALLPLQAEMPAAVPSTTPSSQSTTMQIRLADGAKSIVEASSRLKGYSIVVTDASGLPLADVAVSVRLPEEGATGFFMDGARSAVAYTDASGVARFAQMNWGPVVGTLSVRVTAVKGEMHAGALIEETIVEHTAVPTQVPEAKAAPLTSAPAAPVESAASPVSPTPGTPTSVNSVHSGASPESVPAHVTETAASSEPAVSIVNTGGQKGGSHGSAKKWIILAAVAAGAGIGAALAMSGKGATTAAATTGLSIGSPTISVGH